jgi:hypothetical protein
MKDCFFFYFFASQPAKQKSLLTTYHIGPIIKSKLNYIYSLNDEPIISLRAFETPLLLFVSVL